MSDLVRYEVKDGVAVLTIDNPPVNALAPEVWGQIDEAVKRGVADPAAEALVLIGAGTTFIAGADIKAFDLLKTPADSMARSEGTHALLKRMEDATKPLVAALHGNALGGGLEVAQACHFRVATKDAKVGQPGGHARDHPRRGRHAAAAASRRREDGARDVHRRQAGRGAEGARRRHHRSHRRRRSPDRRDRVRQGQGEGARDPQGARHRHQPRRREGRARGVRGDARVAEEDRQGHARAVRRRRRDRSRA